MSGGPALGPVEAAVAEEIVRLARAQGFTGDPPGAEEPLAASLDSLLLLSLVVAVEDRFHLAIEDDDAAGTASLADLARLVAARAEPGRLPSPGGAP